jgi:hypothetical protein
MHLVFRRCLVFSIALLFSAVLLAPLRIPIRWQMSSSLPLGFYWLNASGTSRVPVSRGEIVLVCRENMGARARCRADKLWQRLGPEGERPKWMHWQTYHRIGNAAEAADIETFEFRRYPQLKSVFCATSSVQ